MNDIEKAIAFFEYILETRAKPEGEYGVEQDGVSQIQTALVALRDAAAKERWQEPNRVLTYDEVARDYKGFAWVEPRYEDSMPCYFDEGTVYIDGYVDTSRKDYEIDEEPKRNYNRLLRCWLRKPTDEERAAVPWEE